MANVIYMVLLYSFIVTGEVVYKASVVCLHLDSGIEILFNLQDFFIDLKSNPII